jgi:DHA2 family multidrug resistance protein-like MFS transporter
VTPPRAGRREWIGLAVLALPCLLYSMDLTVLFLAVPRLSADLEPSSTELLWISDVYGFLLAGLLITMGTVGDRIGRRRLLLTGAAAFGAASVLAAFAVSAEMLIAARALLGVAGATLAPSTLSLIRAMFQDADQRTTAIGIWITSFSAGAALGPLVGGLLLEVFWWGSVFLLAVPVMALLLVVGPRLLPEFRDPDAGALDLPSAILSIVAVLALVYGLKEIAQDGAGPRAAAAIAAGVAAATAFLVRQRTVSYPLLDVRLFRAPAFSTSIAGMYAAVFVVAGIDLFVAQYLQLVLGKSPLEAGLLTLPSAGGLIAGSLLAPALVRRLHGPLVLAANLGITAAGVAILTQIDAGSPIAVIVTGTCVLGFGAGAVGTVATDLVVAAAPAERAGAASAISETSAELGGALGIAVLGSIGTAVYRAELAEAMPAGLPPESADSAGDTLSGAVETAGALPGTLRADLLEAAHVAFTQGLEVAAAVTTAGVLACAALAAAVLHPRWQDRVARARRRR